MDFRCYPHNIKKRKEKNIMHYRTLVTVNIPEVKPDTETDLVIQDIINNLNTALKRCGKSEIGQRVMSEIYLNRYKGMSNAFAREVYNAVDSLLDQYCGGTENPDYLEFEDLTDSLREEYENKSIDCVKLPNGRIVGIHNHIIYDKFIIRDGLVYQKRFGHLKHEKRSKGAKKMKALPDYPYKKLYKSFEDFAEQEKYMDYNDEYEGYGYVYNPDSFYDWYCIGGRWPQMFLVKEECTDFTIGDRDYPDNYYEAPQGYRWVSAARKKDIQWKEMRRCIFNEAIREYKEYRKIFETGIIPDEHYCRITENGVSAYGQLLYSKGETLSEYLTREGVKDMCKHIFSQYAHAYLQDGIYHSCDECTVDKETGKSSFEEWRNMLDEFYNSLDDNAVLVSVDCHF